MTEQRPNILVLLTDQERYGLTRPDNNKVKTPNIDRLSEEGMRFENAYTPISICTPARASLMTGVYPHKHGMLNNCHDVDALQDDLPDDMDTYSELLDQAGYKNMYIGKWHVGKEKTPEDFGFEVVAAEDHHPIPDNSDFRQFQRQKGIEPDEHGMKDEIFTDAGIRVSAKTTMPEEGTITNYLTEKAMETFENIDKGGEPFHLRIDLPGPHHPYVAPEPYASMYDPEDIEPWPNFYDEFENKPQAHEMFVEYRGVEDFDWDTWSEAVSMYYGFMTYIDHQVGRILDKLEEEGLAEDTVVIKTADHGDMTGAHRQFNKGAMMYDEIHHIPMIVRWPEEIEPGTSTDEFVRLMDLMPTFLDLADIEIPEGLHAKSMTPLFKGETPDYWPDSFFAEYHGEEWGLYTQRMVQTQRYKFVYNGPDINEFYDLEEDPHEMENLIDDDSYKEERIKLKRKLKKWMDSTSDPIRKWPPKHFLREEEMAEEVSISVDNTER